MTSTLGKDFLILPRFRYVRSKENPTDLVTRGLTAAEFRRKFALWSNESEWLSYTFVYWLKLEWNGAEEGHSSHMFSTIQGSPDPPAIKF